MADPSKQSFSINDAETEVSPIAFFLIILAVIWGVVVGLMIIPNLIPGYAQSLVSQKTEGILVSFQGQRHHVLSLAMVFDGAGGGSHQ